MTTFLIFAIPIALGLILLAAHYLNVRAGWWSIAISGIAGLVLAIMAVTTEDHRGPLVLFAIVGLGIAAYEERRMLNGG